MTKEHKKQLLYSKCVYRARQIFTRIEKAVKSSNSEPEKNNLLSAYQDILTGLNKLRSKDEGSQ